MSAPGAARSLDAVWALSTLLGGGTTRADGWPIAPPIPYRQAARDGLGIRRRSRRRDRAVERRVDALQRSLASQHRHAFEDPRRDRGARDRHPQRLEHLLGLDPAALH